MTEFKYTRDEKLKKQKLIDALFHKPKSIGAFPVRAFYLFPKEDIEGNLKAGVGCSKKNFKRAVKRNRVKRLLREAWRLHKGTLKKTLEENQQQLLVFLHYSSKELPTQELINEKVAFLIQKLTEIAHESLEKNN